MILRLEQRWDPGPDHGCLAFRLWNLGAEPLRPERLCYASMTRLADGAAVEGGRLVRRFGSHVEIAAPEGLAIAPGEAWTLTLRDLTHAPQNRTQGAMAAWVETAAGPIAAEIGDLQPPEGVARTAPAVAAPPEAPPVAILPWPARVAVGPLGPAATLHPAGVSDRRPFAHAAALHRRLFPTAPGPIASEPVPGGRGVRTARDARIAPGGYTVDLGEEIALAHADADGLRHGLIALTQMAHGARIDPRFGIPQGGRIADGPRFGWRGAHLDVARNFHGPAVVARLIDVLAWHRMSHLHLHLTDDEGWRLESPAHPALTGIGAARGRGLAIPPQFADGPGGQAGFYTVSEMRALVAHAASLGVTVVPEIDTPGHATALLAAIPDLMDPEETPASYRSVQGHTNNAVNPGVERTYEVLATILGEIADLFPSPVLHLGGDEVDASAWSSSPAARRFAEREGIADAMGLQSHFLRRTQAILRGLGRRMGGWDECALGGGVDRDAVLFAWRSAGRTAELVAAGHDVVATPGEACYLDMVDAEGWDAPGTSWAGAVMPEATYRFEIGEPEGPGRLLGLQACLWSEHLDTVARLNAMAFPRLSAVAEAAWTPAAAKSWPRFAALAPLMPRL